LLQEREIIESLRLEKTSKVIKSNRQPNTTMPTKPDVHKRCTKGKKGLSRSWTFSLS